MKKSRNTDTFPVPDLSGNVLVRYSTTRFTVSRIHTEETSNLREKYGSTRNLNAIVRILETRNTVLGRILSLFTNTGLNLKRQGLSLANRQGTLVRIKDLPLVQEIFEKADARLEDLKQEAFRSFDDLLNSSRLSLGEAGRSIEFPTADEVVGSYTHHLDVHSPPGVLQNSFLKDVSREVAAKMRALSLQSQSRMIRDAYGGLIQGLLTHLTGTEADPGLIEHVDRAQRLRDERFANLKRDLEHARRVQKSMGIEFPELDEILMELEPFADIDRASLNRESRTEIGNAMKQSVGRTREILSRMGMTK